MAAAASLQGPVLQPCALCQVTFTSEAQLQQHLTGPVHKKALEKLRVEKLRQERLERYGGVAQAAMEAAAWQGGGGGSASHLTGLGRPSSLDSTSAPPPRGGGLPRGGAQAGGWPTRDPPGVKGDGPRSYPNNGIRSLPPVPLSAPQASQAHQHIVQKALQDPDAPLDLDGWVPPAVTVASERRDIGEDLVLNRPHNETVELSGSLTLSDYVVEHVEAADGSEGSEERRQQQEEEEDEEEDSDECREEDELDEGGEEEPEELEDGGVSGAGLLAGLVDYSDDGDESEAAGG